MDGFKFNCEKCNYHTNKTQYFSIHKKTKKHQKNYEVELQIEDNKRTSKKYHCDYCNYYTDNHRGMYQHKKTKKHIKNIEEKKKIYNCEECKDYGTNDQSEFLKHYKEKHMKQSDYKINTQNNINIVDNSVKNILNIQLNNSKESFKLMLSNMEHNNLLKMLGGVSNTKEFQEKEMWDDEKAEETLINNLMKETLNNMKNNGIIQDLKLTKSDTKNNMIQIKNNKNKYNKYDSTYMLGNMLEDNIKLTKIEHKDRIKNDTEYRKQLILIDSFSQETNFKKGYEYNFNDIIKNIINYTELSIKKLKNGNKFDSYDMKEKLRNYNSVLDCFKEMKKKLEILIINIEE